MAMRALPSTADYLIVGGGTSGLVVASRLSECSASTVVVLESGPDRNEDPEVRNPGTWHSLIGSDLDWGFKIVSQVTSITKFPNERKLTGFTSSLASTIALGSTRLVRFWADLPQ